MHGTLIFMKCTIHKVNATIKTQYVHTVFFPWDAGLQWNKRYGFLFKFGWLVM